MNLLHYKSSLLSREEHQTRIEAEFVVWLGRWVLHDSTDKKHFSWPSSSRVHCSLTRLASFILATPSLFHSIPSDHRVGSPLISGEDALLERIYPPKNQTQFNMDYYVYKLLLQAPYLGGKDVNYLCILCPFSSLK